MQENNLKEGIEKVFQLSNSTDELFDTFRIAIEKKINDSDLYETLLWNKALSKDEIGMYAEKVCKEFPGFCFQIYLAAADVFDSSSFYGKTKELSFQYIQKAAAANPSSYEPYLNISKIYNQEVDAPKFESIVDFILKGLGDVEEKSRLYFILAKLYAKKGELETGRIYHLKGEDAQKNGF